MTSNQFRNLLAFICLVTGESPAVLQYSPDYIIEKFTRYIGRLPVDNEHWRWGHHPALKAVIDDYCATWHVDDQDVMSQMSWPVEMDA